MHGRFSWPHLYLRLCVKPTQDEGLRALSFFYWNAVRVGGVLASVRRICNGYSRNKDRTNRSPNRYGMYKTASGLELATLIIFFSAHR